MYHSWGKLSFSLCIVKTFLTTFYKKNSESNYFSNVVIDGGNGVRVQFKDGWGLVRASNTQPVLVLRFESKTEKAWLKYGQR